MKNTRCEALYLVGLAGLLATHSISAAPSSAMPANGIAFKGQLNTGLVPSPVAYTAMLPLGYENAKDLPLLLALHGGDGIAGFAFIPDEDSRQLANRERINQMKKATGVDPAPLHLPFSKTRP